MKQEIKNYQQLNAEINLLRDRTKIQEEELSVRLINLKTALRPSSLIKSSLSEVLNAGKKDKKLFPMILSGLLQVVLHAKVHREAPLERWLKDLGINASGALVEKIANLAPGFAAKFKDLFKSDDKNEP